MTDPMLRALAAADAVDAAIDARVSPEGLAAVRRRLDETFADVLDVLVRPDQDAYRAVLVMQYRQLAASLDAFELHRGAPH